jgi:hypothetical protein
MTIQTTGRSLGGVDRDADIGEESDSRRPLSGTLALGNGLTVTAPRLK